jgi:glyoxalase family protein
MKNNLSGIHHITAIAGDAQRNYNFYTEVLGLRLVKKTVNFDDPGTYHFYFGDEVGSPGTILTFFPWQHIRTGSRGAGQVTETSFSVPSGSFDYWIQRFETHNVIYNKASQRLGEDYLVFLDPDGLKLELVADDTDKRQPWSGSEIPADKAIRGFYGVTITVNDEKGTGRLLTEILDFRTTKSSGNRYRFEATKGAYADKIDLVVLPHEARGNIAGGSVHHVAFRLPDEEQQLALREEILIAGYQITEQIDRQYFKSLYFREDSGVLFEIATDLPGFTIDETRDELGHGLMLPPQYENRRTQIEAVLPKLEV